MAMEFDLSRNSLHKCSKAALGDIRFRPGASTVFADARMHADEPVIPSEKDFDNLKNESTSLDEGDVTRLPTTSECAVHLELLLCFDNLVAEILKSKVLDTVFGIVAKPQTVVRKQWRRAPKTFQKKDPTFAARRKDKWPLFLALAVARFIAWFKEIDPEIGGQYDDVLWELMLPPLGM
jgi:hypothetical protein